MPDSAQRPLRFLASGLLLLAMAPLLCSCLSRQIGNEAAYIKHTKPLTALFHPPPATTKLPVVIRQWKHNGSTYTIRACADRNIYCWHVEVQHPDGCHFLHKTPQGQQGKAFHPGAGRKADVSCRHAGEQLILTLNHAQGEQVRLHAHNLGYMADNAPTDAASTAALAQAVQQGGRISLRYDDGREYQLTDREQEAMRRILRGAICYSAAPSPRGRAICLYSSRGERLCELPLGEYWPYNHLSAEPGIPSLPTTILTGDYHRTYLPAWWTGASLRLRLSPSPDSNSGPCGPGAISAKQLDELLEKR